MSRFISTLCILICLFVLTSKIIQTYEESKNETQPWEYIIHDAMKSVVIVSGYTKNNKLYQGSGFVINKDGYIITNAHVIEDTYNIKDRHIWVRFSNKTLFLVTDIWIDKKYDIAILKINTKNLPTLRFQEKRYPLIAEEIIGIGSSNDDEFYIVPGRISGRTRVLNEKGMYVRLAVQVNPGCSGGPVLDKYGKVIGIITSQSLYFLGITYSLDVNTITKSVSTILPEKEILEQENETE